MTSPTIEISAADHPVKSATISKSGRVEVIRTFPLDLQVIVISFFQRSNIIQPNLNFQAGRTTVRISHLPSGLESTSVRISTPAEVQVLDVTSTTSPSKRYDYYGPSDSICALNVKRNVLTREKSIREHETSMAVSYGRMLAGVVEYGFPWNSPGYWSEIPRFLGENPDFLGRIPTLLETFGDKARGNTDAVSCNICSSAICFDTQLTLTLVHRWLHLLNKSAHLIIQSRKRQSNSFPKKIVEEPKSRLFSRLTSPVLSF
jgi:hypothetical protein